MTNSVFNLVRFAQSVPSLMWSAFSSKFSLVFLRPGSAFSSKLLESLAMKLYIESETGRGKNDTELLYHHGEYGGHWFARRRGVLKSSMFSFVIAIYFYCYCFCHCVFVGHWPLTLTLTLSFNFRRAIWSWPPHTNSNSKISRFKR